MPEGRKRTRARVWRVLFPVLCLSVLGASQPPLQVDYVLTQAVYQAGMLLGRVPVEDVLASGELTPGRRQRLELADEIRRFSRDEIGLAPFRSYTEVAVGFERRMYNVMACAPDRFQAAGRWFPIVGSIPYIGYFRRSDTQREVRRLRSAGLDVYPRRVGAYSTLGWFDDPILPGMLDWHEVRLADTLIHESAHATLFLSGQMRFNESYARFVGNRGAEAFMQTRREISPDELRYAEESRHDRALMRTAMHELYLELDALYGDDRPRDQVLRRKAEIIADARQRYEELPFQRKAYRTYFQRVKVNNATLLSYRTYNSGDAGFHVIYDGCDRNLRCFVERMQAVEQADVDAFTWLAEQTGIEEKTLRGGQS